MMLAGGVSRRWVASVVRSAGACRHRSLPPCTSTSTSPPSPPFALPSPGFAHPERIQYLVKNYTQFVSFPVYKSQEKVFAKEENKQQIHRELIRSHNGIFKLQIVGNKSSLRCMTTMSHPEVSSAQESSVASPEPSQAQRIKFKRLDKTAKHIMNILDKEAVDKVQAEREIPDIRPGYIIQLKVEVPENKRRASIIKGIVIARRNAGLNTTFRLRRLVAGVGIESVFPLYSPNIKEMKVIDKKKVRRAKLYYLRDRMNPLKK